MEHFRTPEEKTRFLARNQGAQQLMEELAVTPGLNAVERLLVEKRRVGLLRTVEAARDWPVR